MEHVRSDGATQNSTAIAAEASTASDSQPGVTSSAAADNTSKRRRNILRNPFHRPRAATKHNRNSGSNSHRHRVLPVINNDKLCLSAISKLVPQQLMDELRYQITSGAEPLAALQATANNKLGKLDDADVQRLFLAAAAASSASCAAVHGAKRLACIIAKRLRISQPVGFINDILIPTGVYGPLLAAYLAVAAAKGAIRQIKAEGTGGKTGGSEGDLDRDDDQQQQQQQQRRDWEDQHLRGSGAGREEGAGPGWQQQQQYGRGAGQQQYAGDLQQQQQQEGEAGVASASSEQLVDGREDLTGVSSAQDEDPSSSIRNTEGKTDHQQQQPHQQQQQQQQHQAPWWALWKLKHHSRQHQQQRQQRANAASPQAEQLPAPADTPAAAAAAGSWSDSGSAAAKDSSSGGNSGGGGADLVPEVSRHSDRDRAPAESAAAIDGGAAVGTAADTPSVGPYPVPDQDQDHHNSHKAQQQQQWQQEDGDFAMPLLALSSSSSPIPTPRTLDNVPDCQSPQDQATPRTPAQIHTSGISSIPLSPLPRFLSQISPRSDHSSDLRSDHPDHPSSVSSPTELGSRVDKLQRRWSSTDHSGLVNEGLRLSQLAEPYRPPVFSRLASGRGACRITAAAAAKEEAEERPDHLTVQGSDRSSSSSKFMPGRSVLALPANPGVLHGSVSMDLGSEAASHGGLRAHDPPAGLHKAHSDISQMHPVGPLAAESAGERHGSSSSSSPSSSRDGKQQESRQAVGRKIHKGADWGHKLMASDSCQQS